MHLSRTARNVLRLVAGVGLAFL
ncbi:MAG: hypothetical protein QOD72_3585, partial [Acidimicrobiaceae bacterium]|nr:hypothetical protein [Acidimicrobiaceae bacterium]